MTAKPKPRILRVGEQVREGDQFNRFHSCWKNLKKSEIDTINWIGGVSIKHKGCFRRPVEGGRK